MALALMIDSETLGTRPTSKVVSIGACIFNDNKQAKIDDFIDDNDEFTSHVFYAVIDTKMQDDRTIDPDTVKWWMNQSPMAREVLNHPNAVSPLDACRQLVAFIEAYNPRFAWCNGATFDFPIIGSLMRDLGMEFPIPYYNQLDMRTVRHLKGDRASEAAFRCAVDHNAALDAIKQTIYLTKMLTS